jgi:hypothetical protein
VVTGISQSVCNLAGAARARVAVHVFLEFSSGVLLDLGAVLLELCASYILVLLLGASGCSRLLGRRHDASPANKNLSSDTTALLHTAVPLTHINTKFCHGFKA